MENNYILYMHTAPNGKVYIGITSRDPQRRWRNGKGYESSPHFKSAIEKYGWENIKHEIIFTGLSKKDACQFEKNFIQLYDSTNREHGYNETFGGDEGLKITPEVRKKISMANKRVYADPKYRKMLSDRMKNNVMTEETRKKLSKSHMGLCTEWTKEHRDKAIQSIRSYYSDPANAEIIKERSKKFAQYGYKKSRKVCQYSTSGEFINTYESMKEAGRQTGIRDGNISKCCNGKAKSAGGYIWQYAS